MPSHCSVNRLVSSCSGESHPGDCESGFGWEEISCSMDLSEGQSTTNKPTYDVGPVANNPGPKPETSESLALNQVPEYLSSDDSDDYSAVSRDDRDLNASRDYADANNGSFGNVARLHDSPNAAILNSVPGAENCASHYAQLEKTIVFQPRPPLTNTHLPRHENGEATASAHEEGVPLNQRSSSSIPYSVNDCGSNLGISGRTSVTQSTVPAANAQGAENSTNDSFSPLLSPRPTIPSADDQFKEESNLASAAESTEALLALKLPSTALFSSFLERSEIVAPGPTIPEARSVVSSSKPTEPTPSLESADCEQRTIEWIGAVQIDISTSPSLAPVDELHIAERVASGAPACFAPSTGFRHKDSEGVYMLRHRRYHARAKNRRRARSTSRDSDSGASRKIEKDRGGGESSAVNNTHKNANPARGLLNSPRSIVRYILLKSIGVIILALIVYSIRGGYLCFEEMGTMHFAMEGMPLFPFILVPVLQCESEMSHFEYGFSYAARLSRAMEAKDQLVVRQYYNEIKELVKTFDDFRADEVFQPENSGSRLKKPAAAEQNSVKCIVEGLHRLNGTMRKMPMHIAEMQTSIAMSARQILEAIELIQSSLGLRDNDLKNFELRELFVPGQPKNWHRKLAQSFMKHLMDETRYLKNMTNVIAGALNETWIANDRLIDCMRVQKQIYLEASEESKKAHPFSIFFGERIPQQIRRILRAIGLVVIDEEAENERAAGDIRRRNSAKQFFEQAETQAQIAREIVFRMAERFQGFDEQLKNTGKIHRSFLHYYARWKKIKRWDIAEDIVKLKRQYREISGVGNQRIG